MSKIKKFFVAMAMILPLAAMGTAIASGGATSKPLSGVLSPQQRGAAIAQFVRKWGPYVENTYGLDVHTWSQRMVMQFAVGDAINIQRALGRTTFEGAMAELNGVGQRLTDKQAISMLASSSFAPGSIPSPDLLGSVTNDLVYTVIAPCRLVDSRVTGGPIPANTSRDFHAWGHSDYTSQGGSATDCGLIAENPSAVVVNVTVIGPVGAGFLTAYAFGTPRPGTASVNYASGAIVNNTIITPLAPGTPNFDFTLYSLRQTNVVVDIVGYFDAPHATALDCIEIAGAPVSMAPGSYAQAFAPSCTAGYTRTGIGCDTGTFDTPLFGTGPLGNCVAKNNTSSTINFTATTTCCRIPGR